MQFKNEDRKGYMKKLKNSSFNRIFGNTNLRWFELDFSTRTFGYRDEHNSPTLKNALRFSEIKDVTENVKLDDKALCDWQNAFRLSLFTKREYILFCQTKTEVENWIKGFAIVLNKVPIVKTIVPKNSIFREPQQIEYKAPPKSPPPKEIPVEKPVETPVIIEEKPVRKRVIINENTTKYNLNSSNMLYDQDLADFMENVNKSVDIEDSYLSTNNLNRSYASNNSQILVNHNLNDWNFYDEEGRRIKEEDNANKEMEDHRKERLRRRKQRRKEKNK